MSFKERLQRYQRGEASEAERRAIEEELEKYQELTEFYFQKDNEQMEELQFADENSEIFRKIKRATKKNRVLLLLSAVILSVCTVTLIPKFYYQMFRPFINQHFFYYPFHCSIGGEVNDLTLKLSTLNELHCPGKRINFVGGVESGIGDYELQIHETDLMDPFNFKPSYSGKVEKGEVFFGESFLNYWPSGIFKNEFSLEEGWSIQSAFHQQTAPVGGLSDLPSYILLQSAVSFTQDLSMKEIQRMIKEYPQLDFVYVAIRDRQLRATDEQERLIRIGFNPKTNRSLPVIRKEAFQDRYPFFILSSEDATREDFDQVMIQHFCSLIRYHLDTIGKERFAFYESVLSDRAYYQKTLDYVNQNGLYSYGVVIQGNAPNLKYFCENEKAGLLYIHDAKLQIEEHGMSVFQP